MIALIELAKGALALLAASGLELMGPAPLQHWVHLLIDHFQLDPDRGAMAWLLHSINPEAVHLAARLVAVVVAINLILVWALAHDLFVWRR